MKLRTFIIVSLMSLLLINTMAQEECVNCGDSQPPMISFGDYSGRVGFDCKPLGDYSFTGGLESEANGPASLSFGYQAIANSDYSIALGYEAYANSYHSIALGCQSSALQQKSIAIGWKARAEGMNSISIGNYLRSAVGESFTLGRGFNPDNPLVNNNNYSLAIGFYSDIPTFFISSSNGLGTTGKVGIGTTNPLSKFHVKSDDGKLASIFIEPSVFNNISPASIFLGDFYHGMTADFTDGLIFHTQNNYLFESGKIGIGIMNPLYNLHVNGSTYTKQFTLYDPETMPHELTGWVLRCDEYGNGFWTDPSFLYDDDWTVNQQDIYRIDGNVGIGTEAPQSKLEVQGYVSIGYNEHTLVGENGLIVNGKVGIGTSNPECELEITGKLKTTQFQLSEGALNNYILQCDNEGHAFWVNPADVSTGGWTKIGNNVFVDANIKVGIGTDNPVEPLHLNGNLFIEGDIKGGRNDWQPLKIYAGTDNTDGAYILMNSNYNQTGSVKIFARGESGRVELWNKNGQIISLRANNNVYFGSENHPSNIYVNGEVSAQLVRAKLQYWNDHVLSPGYELTSLEELEQYIQEHHHLPEIPSESEVIKNGIDLGEMNALLLKKIEELTLYLIEQEKNYELLKEEIEKLKNHSNEIDD